MGVDLVKSFGDALSSIRRELSSALASSTTTTTATGDGVHSNTAYPASTSTAPPPSIQRRLSSALASLLDSGPGPLSSNRADQSTSHMAGTSENRRSAPEPGGLGRASSSRLTAVPFAGDSHHVLPLREEQVRGTLAGPTPGGIAPAIVGEQTDEELPSYSRRPIGGPRSIHLPPMTLHIFTSKTGKLELNVKARGDQHAIMIQEDVDADVPIDGTLLVSLPTAEAISFIKIRVKCMVRTMVMRVHGSSRHPVVDERVLWEDQQLLWEQNGDTFLPANESSDPAKLQGRFEFPFELKLPGRFPVQTDPASPILARSRAPPPSFVLSGTAGPDATGLTKGAEWASARYYIKVTLARKGLLKINERFITPLIYVPCHAEPEVSPLRAVALAQGRPTPGPLEDPTGWAEQKVRHTVKRGVWNGKKAWYEVSLLLPVPLRFARLSVLPFAVKIRSSDPNTTSRFPLSSVTAVLIQRSYIAAQGLLNTHDLVLGQGQLMNDGAPEGTPLRPTGSEPAADVAVWERSLRGSFELVRRCSVSESEGRKQLT